MGMKVKHDVLRLLLLCIATCVSAQTLSYVSPIISPVVAGLPLAYYTVGDDVNITWVTPFLKTTVLVYQLREDHNWAYDILAVNNPKSNTSVTWKAHQIAGTPLNNKHPFKFVLENGESYACAGCVVYSPKFLVKEKDGAAAATTGHSHTTTNSPKAASTSPSQSHHTTSPANAHQSQGVAAAEGGHGTSSTLTSSHSTSHSHLGIGLGVGLGLGIPILLALLALLFFLRRRRRQNQRISYHPTGSGNWATEQTGMREAGNRESGALGPWQGDRPSSQNSSQVPVQRPSYAHSGSAMSRMSHRSWIDDFEFEKPGMQNQDAMSQLRQSMHGSGTPFRDDSPRPSSGVGLGTGGYSTPRGSSSRGDAPLVPLVQQPVIDFVTPSSTPVPATAARSDTNFGNTDLSSLEGMPEQVQASPLRPQRRSRGDGRDWPLP